MLQNFAFSANSAKFAIFVQYLWYFHKISRFLLDFFQEILKYRTVYRNKFIVNNLITCDRFVYCSDFVTYFIICQQKLHYIIITLHKMVKLLKFGQGNAKKSTAAQHTHVFAKFQILPQNSRVISQNFQNHAAKFQEICRKFLRSLAIIRNAIKLHWVA